MVLFTLSGIAYIFIAEPVYEANAFVQPPSQNDIAGLNYGRGGSSGLPLMSAKDVYDVYLRSLQSESLRRDFFKEIYLPVVSGGRYLSSQDELYAKFNKALAVEQVSKGFQGLYSVSARAADPGRAVEWVQRYSEMAGEHARKEVLADVKSDLDVVADNLDRQISIERNSASKQREDQIAQLKEALIVAKTVGLEKPPIISNNLSSEISAGMNGSLTYMRGSKALSSEIDNLENRPSDDPYITGLRKKQADLAFYRSLVLNVDGIKVYRQDGGVELPDEPIKPSRKMVLLVSPLLGLVLGVLLVTGIFVWREGLRVR